MILTIAIAVALFAAAQAIKRRDYLVDVGWRGVWQWSVGMLILAVGVAILAGLLGAGVREAGVENPYVATGVPAMLSAAAFHLLLRIPGRIDRIKRCIVAIRVEEQRAEVRERVLGLLEEIRASETQHAMELLCIALALKDGRYYQEARELIVSTQERGLDAYESELAAMILASSCTYMNDKPAAKAALDALPPLTEGSDHAHVRDLLKALMAVREGDGDTALALIDTVDERQCVAMRLMVSAHTLVALDRHEEAGEALDQLEKERGAFGLHWTIETQGPASPMAERRLHGTRAPYR